MNVKQTKELLNIINKNQLIAIGTNFGPDFFTDEDKELLDAYRVPWRRLYKTSNDPIQMSFAFGMLAEALKDQVKNISYENFKAYIESGNYIPMSDLDKAIVNNVKLTAFSSAKTLQGKIFSDVNGVVNNKSKQAEWLQAEARRGLKDKKTVAEIAREIAEKTGDWSRNFERMIAYAAHTALENGKAAMMMKDWGPDVLVYKQPMKGACKHCIRLYLTNGEGSAPRVFKLSQLIANGSNIGRKTADWKATLDSLHPYCFDDQTEVLTDEGWKLFEDLNKKEKFLSVDLETGDACWVSAVEWIEYRYKGKMKSFEGKNLSMMTSPNHHHVIKTYNKPALRLVEGKDLPKNAYFLKTIPNWQGENANIVKIGENTFPTDLFVKFLGFFISEGAVVNYKGRLRIHIAQSEEKYLDEIFETCSSLFDEFVSKCKGYVQISCGTKWKDVYEYVRTLGTKANNKKVPQLIKDLSKEKIDIFLDAFCKGDGSFVKGRMWDSRVYYTSSNKLASDIGELLLKIGRSPSYTYKEPQEIFDPKRNKSYKQNQGIWHVNECTSQYVYNINLKKEDVDYDGYIYDVELEELHTLVVRRNGKTWISGNCRCPLHRLPSNKKWNNRTKKFEVSKDKKQEAPSRKRAPIRVVIGGKEYKV